MSIFNLFNLFKAIFSFEKINFKTIGLILSGIIVIFSIYEFVKTREDLQDKLIKQEHTIMVKDTVINNLQTNMELLKIKHADEIKKIKLEYQNKCNKEKLFNTFKNIDYKYNHLTPDIFIKKDINVSKKDISKKEPKRIWIIKTNKDIDKLDLIKVKDNSVSEPINLLIK